MSNIRSESVMDFQPQVSIFNTCAAAYYPRKSTPDQIQEIVASVILSIRHAKSREKIQGLTQLVFSRSTGFPLIMFSSILFQDVPDQIRQNSIPEDIATGFDLKLLHDEKPDTAFLRFCFHSALSQCTNVWPKDA